MSHHKILKATIVHESAVILTEHTNCERGFLKDCLQGQLQEELSKTDILYKILISEEDRDPISIVTAQ
jgi:putative NIF3 family GTP cyclohydrolase 1 type 2